MSILYNLIAQKKDDARKVYIYHKYLEKTNNTNLKIKQMIDIIEKQELENNQKNFLINQSLNRKNGIENNKQDDFDKIEFSISQLYELVQKKIRFILSSPSPFAKFYPIITADVPAIDDIALFIACLKLGKKPLVFDPFKVELNKLQIEDELIDNNGFYLLSSGSTSKPKIKGIIEEKFFSQKNVERNSLICNRDFYCQSPLYGISGIVLIFINTLIKNNRIFFEQYYRNGHGLTPFFDELNGDGLYFNEESSNYIIGKYNSPYLIYKTLIREKNKLDTNNGKIFKVNYYGYGQTESNGLIALNSFEDARVIVLDAIDILTVDYKIKSIKFIENNILKKGLFKLMHISKKYPIKYLSVGKVDESISIEGKKQIGEILVDQKKTGDIGCIVDGYLFLLYRENDLLSIFKQYIKYKYCLNPTFDKNEKNFVIDCDEFDVKYLCNAIKLKGDIEIIKRDFGVEINYIPLCTCYPKSPGLSKNISNGESVSKYKLSIDSLKKDEIYIESIEYTRAYFLYYKFIQLLEMDQSKNFNYKYFRKKLFKKIKEDIHYCPENIYDQLLVRWYDEYKSFEKNTGDIIKMDASLFNQINIFIHTNSIIYSYIFGDRFSKIVYFIEKEKEEKHEHKF